jgi:hypothetical protein
MGGPLFSEEVKVMPIVVQCPCSARLKVPDQLTGKRVKCPKCGVSIAVPNPVSDIGARANFIARERDRVKRELADFNETLNEWSEIASETPPIDTTESTTATFEKLTENDFPVRRLQSDAVPQRRRSVFARIVWALFLLYVPAVFALQVAHHENARVNAAVQALLGAPTDPALGDLMRTAETLVALFAGWAIAFALAKILGD